MFVETFSLLSRPRLRAYVCSFAWYPGGLDSF
jgi:hypothetical protein